MNWLGVVYGKLFGWYPDDLAILPGDHRQTEPLSREVVNVLICSTRTQRGPPVPATLLVLGRQLRHGDPKPKNSRKADFTPAEVALQQPPVNKSS